MFAIVTLIAALTVTGGADGADQPRAGTAPSRISDRWPHGNFRMMFGFNTTGNCLFISGDWSRTHPLFLRVPVGPLVYVAAEVSLDPHPDATPTNTAAATDDEPDID